MRVLNESNAQFEQEWIANAKTSVGFIIRLAPILMIAYWPLDIAYIPNHYYRGFLIRVLSLPLSFLIQKFLDAAKTKQQVLTCYATLVFSYAMLVDGLIYISGDINNLYFLGLIVVAVGAYSFLSLPKSMSIAIGFIVFSPFVIYECIAGMVAAKAATFSVYMMDGACCLIVLYYANENFFRFQRKEFDSRTALNQLLKQRDEAIAILIDELSTLKIKQADYVMKEEAFKLARQVAHDIRAPISALNAATRKLKNSSSDLAEFIDASSKRINDIADSMLKKSRQELANQNSLYVNDMVKIICAIVEEKKLAVLKFPEKRIEFELDFPSTKAPLRTKVFEADISRVLSNLLENSIDAISGRGVIKVECAVDTGGQIRLGVHDNGKGIPPEILASIGKYGFTYGKSNGSGLGLAFAFNVVKTAGGNIKITSEPKKNTTVEISLPRLEQS